MIKLFLISSENNNSFGVNIVLKCLTKELKKYCQINEKFHFNKIFKTNNKILHIHGCWSLKILFNFIIAKLINIKIILSPHGMADPYSFKLKPIKKKIAWIFFQRFIFKFSDLIIVNSFLEKKNICNLIKVKKIKIIPHGINGFKKIKVNKLSKNKKIKFVYFSRIHPVKNLQNLIDIWINHKFFTNHKLYIYGDVSDSEYFRYIKQRIFKKDNLIYRGPLYKNKIKVLSKYDVLLYPSHSENFGLVILEALAAGLFLVINKNLPWKFLQNKNFASLIKFDKKNLICTIKNIEKNKNKIFSIKRIKNIEKTLKKNYKWEKIALKYYKIYNSI